MRAHRTGTREEWLRERLELLVAEKELTRRSDELARRRQALPWVTKAAPRWRISSRAPLARLQAYKRRMGWTFPWASSLRNDFNTNFSVSFTEQEQRAGGIEYNYRRGGHPLDATRALVAAPRRVPRSRSMCPVCITTAVLSAAGAASGASAIAVVAGKWRGLLRWFRTVRLAWRLRAD
jgi:hypothetical protein